LPFNLNAVGKTVLIIGDTHIPYSHPDYLDFLKYLKKIWKPQIVIHIGDELDYHAISFHNSETSLFSADHELERAIEEIDTGLHKLFPKMYILESNHGSLICRKLKANGIPIRTLKQLNELYNTHRWQWHNDILLKTKLFTNYICHGKTGTIGKLAKDMMCCAIQGHYHAKFCVNWYNSAMGPRFDAYTGCLVDTKSMAMVYARNNLPDPIMGSLILDNIGMPRPMKMQLDKHGRWNGKV